MYLEFKCDSVACVIKMWVVLGVSFYLYAVYQYYIVLLCGGSKPRPSFILDQLYEVVWLAAFLKAYSFLNMVNGYFIV